MSYDPTIGKWVQRDPIGYPDGMNAYEFVGSNPVTRLDPTGTDWAGNWDLFWDWVRERGDDNLKYGPDHPATLELAKSRSADDMRAEFKFKNCPTFLPGNVGTGRAAHNSFAIDLGMNATEAQVGGFLWEARNNGDGTVTYTVQNQLSMFSFFYHVPRVPHKPRGGSFPFMGNLNQTFTWTEPVPCCNPFKWPGPKR